MFEGRRLAIATKHAKERVIAPVLEEAIGVHCFASDSLDTDRLGTFTGEVERTLDPLATARRKCELAMEASGCDLAVASEGSFGPHPAMPFVPGDDELILFVDRRHALEIAAREVSAATNFAAERLADENALLAFAERAGFPGHALILRMARDSASDVHKGITDRETLLQIFRELRQRHGAAHVETDMRAMYNPMRMAVIEAAARKLTELLDSRCPGCDMPGFTVTEVKRGLPCSVCRLPTEGVSRHIFECRHCGASQELRNPNGKTEEDPMYCGFCNP